MTAVLPSPARRSLLWIALIWTGVGLLNAIQVVASMYAQHMQHRWPVLFIAEFLYWLPWALVTPLVLAVIRSDIAHRTSSRSWPMHLLLLAAVWIVWSLWSASIEWWLEPYAPYPPAQDFWKLCYERAINGLASAMILYAFVLAVGTAWHSRERISQQQVEAARLNESLATARLDALRHQVEPHFLFNTLNSIAGLIREQRNSAAISMVVGLADFLRSVVNEPGRAFVSLEEELASLAKYLHIQQVRFGDRLRVTLDVPGDLQAASVPRLLLQPLIENAIKHGIERRAEGGEVRVTIASTGGRLAVRVYNDGMPAAEHGSSGIGLANLRHRLAILYGPRFDLALNPAAGGTEVLVVFPLSRQ